jgi:hypothetical protein
MWESGARTFPFDLPRNEAQSRSVVSRIRIFKFLVLQFLLFAVVASLAQITPETNAPLFKQVKLFDLKKDGAWVFKFCPGSRELFVSFGEEGNRIVHRWNVDTGREMNSYKLPKLYRCDEAAISPNGRILVLAAYNMSTDVLHKTDMMRLVDVETAKIVKEISYFSGPRHVKFNTDGNHFLAEGLILTYKNFCQTNFVYDLKGNRESEYETAKFRTTESSNVWVITNSKGGPRPGLFCRDSEGKEQRLYPDDHAYWSDAGDYVVSTDNRFVACATNKGKLMIWRLSDRERVFESQAGGRWIRLAYDPKTDRFLFADGGLDKVTSLQALELAKPR